MTIEVLSKALEEAINNGLGNCPIYARFSGDDDKNRKEIDFININSFSDDKCGEVVLRR